MNIFYDAEAKMDEKAAHMPYSRVSIIVNLAILEFDLL